MPLFRPVSCRRRLRAAARLLILGCLALALSGCLAPKRVGIGPRPLGPTPSAGGGEPLLVRVGMAEGVALAAISCDGPWTLGAGAHSGREALLDADRVASLVRSGDGVAVLDSMAAMAGAWLVAAPRDPDHRLRWDGRHWRGELHVIPTPGGTGLTVINVVELERYLAGVVPREIGNGRQREDLNAIAAQAVAARTYTISRLDAQRARGFDLYADVRDQAYGGADWEDPLCKEALELTAGLVLRRGEDLAPAYYHSTCGGHTANIEAVWPYASDPVLRGRPDQRPDGRPWCADSRYIGWREQWTWLELESILVRTLPRYVAYVSGGGRAGWSRGAFVPADGNQRADAPGRLLYVKVTRRTPSGRVAELAITMSAGRYTVRGDRTRWVLTPPEGGPTLLRSSWFDLEVDGGRSVTATGRGWGHGLGMCQMGALGRSRAGQDFRDILDHYYRGTRLTRLDTGGLP